MQTTELKLRREYFYFDWHTHTPIKVKYVLSIKDNSPRYRFHRRTNDGFDNGYIILVKKDVENCIFDNFHECVIAAAGVLITTNLGKCIHENK